MMLQRVRSLQQVMVGGSYMPKYVHWNTMPHFIKQQFNIN